MTYPVYYVIAEQGSGPAELTMWGLPRTILAVYECDLADVHAIWRDVWYDQQANGRRLDSRVYTREAANPFREWASRPVDHRVHEENSK